MRSDPPIKTKTLQTNVQQTDLEQSACLFLTSTLSLQLGLFINPINSAYRTERAKLPRNFWFKTSLACTCAALNSHKPCIHCSRAVSVAYRSLKNYTAQLGLQHSGRMQGFCSSPFVPDSYQKRTCISPLQPPPSYSRLRCLKIWRKQGQVSTYSSRLFKYAINVCEEKMWRYWGGVNLHEIVDLRLR